MMFFTVLPKIVPFHFGEEPTFLDETVSISCSVSAGDLPLNITWSLNGKLINSNDGDIKTVNLGKRVSSLTIDNVSAKHAGNYTCYAQNLAGSGTFTSILIVNGLSPFIAVF